MRMVQFVDRTKKNNSALLFLDCCLSIAHGSKFDIVITVTLPPYKDSLWPPTSQGLKFQLSKEVGVSSFSAYVCVFFVEKLLMQILNCHKTCLTCHSAYLFGLAVNQDAIKASETICLAAVGFLLEGFSLISHANHEQ